MAAPLPNMFLRRLFRTSFGRVYGHNNIPNNLKTPCSYRGLYVASNLCSESNGNAPAVRDPETIFLGEKVQQLLYKVTEFNVDKIFHSRPRSDIKPPQYKLITDKQLTEEQNKAIQKARQKIRMPPVMKARKDEYEVISDDKDIAGHDTVKYVFTDVTFGLKDRERTMVVRESDGLLRTATASERDRLMNVYLQPEGRMHSTPRMFIDQHFERILEEGKYEYILERALVQFEPDDPEYIRVCQRTYEHVDNAGAYDELDSTRYYGGMIFYFAYYNKLDGIILHNLRNNELGLAADLVRLHNVVHPSSASTSASTDISDDNSIIQNYISHDAKRKAELELALQHLTTEHHSARQ